MAKAERKGSLAVWGWIFVAGLAAFELLAHSLIRVSVPRDDAWESASAFVRERFDPADRIVAAPSWVEPIVRRHLGDLLSLQSAAPSDGAGIARIWEIGIRGASIRDEPPALTQRFDRVRVRMWPVSSEQLVYDFVEQIEHATVELGGDEGAHPCPWQRAPAMRGGLGQGPMAPSERFVCDAQRPWLWVGATVLTDLELKPRRCVWQHPAGTDPVRVVFDGVPLGERLIVRAGIDYEHARWRAYSPVRLRIWIDDQLVAELVHEDEDGWSGIEIETSQLAQEQARIRFETTAENPTARAFCWSARSVR